ncbi:MAG: PilN domain-containing protein [Coleofasciculus sp. C1-SOL-03]|jgi:type IV pilus assembly protein PilN|uniref:PilN domain-containing protein n=1 Tax=Coleofasciculus sp. C1-SOL-03 TaxID=3069522 RepID=UPI0032F8829A
MYSLDINFLKDRPEYHQAEKGSESPKAKKQIQMGEMTPLILGVIVGLLPLALAAGIGFLLLPQQNAKLNQDIAEIDAELQSLQAEKNKINNLNTQIQAVRQETEALATVFNQIKPWSAILQDIRDRVPTGVQIQAIEQTETETEAAEGTEGSAPLPTINVEISGVAETFDDVNNFLLTLKQSPFFQDEETRIVSAQLVDNPTELEAPEKEDNQDAAEVTYDLPPVVDYTVQTSLTNVPASELLREIDRKGAVGLVARIKALQQIEQNQATETPSPAPSPSPSPTETTTE